MSESALMRVALVVAYDGTDLEGWQRQPQGRTVQGLLEDAIATIVRSPVTVEGSGRTDAGAHATGQVAHADVPPQLAATDVRHRLNALLPPDVRVMGATGVPATFHARKSALGKRYRYSLRIAAVDAPVTRRVRWHVTGRVDAEAMRRAARAFEGERDFASLRSEGSSTLTTVRRIDRCELVGVAPEVDVVVEGGGFLRHMVRAIAGTLIEIGRGRLAVEDVEPLLVARDRASAGPNAPARGLTLEAVSYGQPVDGALAAAVLRAGSIAT